MNLLILGATGATGKQVVLQALAAGHHLRALVRAPSKITTTDARLEVVKGDVTSSTDLEPALKGREAVISVLGPRINADPVCPSVAKPLVAAMSNAGVKRLVWLSAGGVGDSAATLTRAAFVFGRIIMPLPQIRIRRTGYVALAPLDAETTGPLAAFLAWLTAEQDHRAA